MPRAVLLSSREQTRLLAQCLLAHRFRGAAPFWSLTAYSENRPTVAHQAQLMSTRPREGAPKTLGSAIEQLDTPALFDWLITALSYQGISNGAASAYLEKHGSVSWAE